MMVKICGITNRQDALAAAAYGASALGFNFYPKSPRYIPPEEAARLIEVLPSAVWKVGVFVNAPKEDVLQIAARTGLDIVQLHGDELAGEAPEGVRVWKAFRVGEAFDPHVLDAYPAEAFVLDAPSDRFGGTGVPFLWSRVQGIQQRIILAGGLDAANVREAIRTVRPWGVDACSRLEIAPGKKDHSKMAEFIQAALAEDA